MSSVTGPMNKNWFNLYWNDTRRRIDIRAVFVQAASVDNKQ